MMSRHDPFPEVWAGPVLGARILLADGAESSRATAIRMLRSLGADVIVAIDGLEALASFEQSPVDLVVLDAEMPRLSGIEVIRAIRARPDRRSKTPIVALTADAVPEQRDRLAAAGADGLIAKPVLSIGDFGRALALGLRTVRTGGEGGAIPSLDGPVVDMTVFEALAAAIGGETMDELLDNVSSDLSKAEAELVEALGRLDLGAIRATAHILISVGGAIGANRLQLCARKLYAAAHAGERDGLAAKVCACLGEISAAMAFARRGPAGG